MAKSRQAKQLYLVIATLAAGTVLARRLGYKVGGNVVVRCRQGLLLTILWIPGVKLKAIDLGVARLQRSYPLSAIGT